MCSVSELVGTTQETLGYIAESIVNPNKKRQIHFKKFLEGKVMA